MKESSSNLTVPIAIVIAGLVIAGAIFYVNSGDRTSNTNGNTNDTQVENVDIRPVSEDDHILGNPNADIVIVEYSDFECPFCKDYHDTLHRVIDEYGADGTVAWVFRQLPIEQLHSKAPKEAQASECAAKLGGNDAFWAYADQIFAETPSNNGLNLDRLPEIATEIGLDRDAFTQCLESGEMSDEVQADVADAQAAGARGTPHSVIIAEGQQVPLEGAQPYAAMQAIIESITSGAVPAQATQQ